MSFNLNKSEEPSGPAKKSNFELSKSDSEVPSQEPKKPAYWLFAAIALLVIAGAAWLLTPRGASGMLSPGDTSVALAAGQADAAGARPDTGLAARQPAADGSPAIKDSVALKKDPGSADTPAAKPATADVAPVGSAPLIAASFKAGSVNPRVTAKSIVEIRNKIKSGAVVSISVLGYASSEGDLTINQSISQQRADAYKQVLVSKGIAEGMITAQGKGIENPVASNDTEAGRKKNRRVEVSF
jgi:outer membrane protein OmpA-like peptidoglycan-associated protein